jgi:AcrR family transcriptional regulator
LTARSVARRQRAPRGEGDKLRNQILDAAEKLLVDLGSDEAVSVRAIAEAVGVTPPSIYRHFADKDELVYEICERRFADFNKAMESADIPGDPVAAIRAMGIAYLRFALDHPEHYRVLMMTARERDIKKKEDSQGKLAFDHLVEATQRCIDAGLCRNDDAVRMAVALWSGVHGLCSLLITARAFPWPAPPEQLAEALLDVQLNGLLKPA